MIGYMNGLAADDHRRPAAEAVRVQRRRRRAASRRPAGFVRGLADGEAVPAAAVLGIAGIVVVLGLQRWLPKVPGGARPGRARDRRHVGLRPGARGVSLVGVLPQGFPPFTLPHGRAVRPRPAGRGSRSASPWSSLADTISTSSVVRRPHRAGGRREPGDDRDRRREPGRRALPGLPGEHQRLADGGRRAGRARRLSSPAWSAPRSSCVTHRRCCPGCSGTCPSRPSPPS